MAQVCQARRLDVGDDARTRGLARRGAYNPHTILLSLLPVSWVGSDAWLCSPDVAVHTHPAGRSALIAAWDASARAPSTPTVTIGPNTITLGHDGCEGDNLEPEVTHVLTATSLGGAMRAWRDG